jgi:hypothetical protein
MYGKTFPAIPTCEIPVPVLDAADRMDGAAVSLPRILAQRAGVKRAERRVAAIAAAFALVAAFELALLVRLHPPGPLVVYETRSCTPLTERAR